MKKSIDNKEIIEVRILPGSTRWGGRKYYMALEINSYINEKMLLLIKEAIEKILNDKT